MDSLGPSGLCRMIKDWEDKSATAICLMAFMENFDSEVHIFEGISNGKIVEPRGDRMFGWDPCFQPNGYEQTFGEMDDDTKNSLSHRYKSLEKLRKFLIEKSNIKQD